MLEKGYTVYGKFNCQGCEEAKAVLESRHLGYEYVDVLKSPSAQQLFKEKGFRSVPQVFYNGEHIGNSQDLVLFLHSCEGHGS